MKALQVAYLAFAGLVAIFSVCVDGNPRALGGPRRVASDDATEDDEDASKIDVATATAFHKRLDALCVSPSIQVSYSGPLAQRRGRLGLAPYEGARTYLAWEVIYFAEVPPDEPLSELARLLLRFCVSLNDRDETVAKCKVGATWLYISITNVAGKRGIDDRIPELEGATAREFLGRLESAIE